ncbi:ABC transporter permease [Lactobacillaceae bacterium Scapto_B20]
MGNLIKRNLTIYFSNRSAVFFSMMASLISFVIYIVFLKHNMQLSWQHVPGTSKLLDPWLIGGTMAVTGLTTTGMALSLIVTDRERHRIYDLELTDLSGWQIQAAYLINAMIIGTVNQMVTFVIMSGYFQLVDGANTDWSQIGIVFLLAIFSSLVWTALNLVVYSLINKVSTISAVNSIVGTVSGFFAGVYIPISSLPDFGQTIMKCTPAPYISAMYRHFLMQSQLHSSFKHLPASVLKDFRVQMGVDMKIKTTTLSFTQMNLVLVGFFLAFIVLLILINNFKKRGVGVNES